MIIIKYILIFLLGFYALVKLIDRIRENHIDFKDEILNLIEIVVSIALTFIIFKI